MRCFGIKRKTQTQTHFKHCLRIYFTDSTTRRIWHYANNKQIDMAHWKDFYKWYFGRPQSNYYRFSHAAGELVLQRKSIASFEIYITEEIKRVPEE